MPRKSLISWAVPAGIVAIAAALRLAGLGAQSFWHDEVSTLLIAGRPLLHTLAINALADINPPLSYVLLNPWVRLGQSEAWARFLPALLGVASVAALYGLGRRLVGPRSAATGALLLAASPFHVYFSQELRYYSLLSLIAILSTWALVRWIERGDRRSQHIYVLAAAATVWTHLFGALLIAGHLVALLVLRRKRASSLPWHWAGIKIAILCLPLLFPILVQVAFNRSFRYRAQAGLGRSLWEIWVNFGSAGPEARVPGVLPWIESLPHGSTGFMAAVAGLSLFFWALVIIGWTKRRFNPIARLVLLCAGPLPILLALLSSRLLPLMRANYLIGFYPMIALAAGAGFEAVHGRRRSMAVLVLAVALCVDLLSIKQARGDPRFFRDDWRGATAELGGIARKNDLVLVYHDGAAGGFLNYYRGPAPVEHILLTDPFLFKQLDPARIEAWIKRDLRKHRPERIWLVTSYGSFNDPEGFARRYMDGHWISDPRIDFVAEHRVEILLYYPDPSSALRGLGGRASEAVDLAGHDFDPLQLARGFQHQPGQARAWMGPEGIVLLRSRGERRSIELYGYADVSFVKNDPIDVRVKLGTETVGSFTLIRTGGFERRIELPAPIGPGEAVSITLEAAPGFVPSAVGFPGDDRPKTIQISRVALVE